MHNYFHPTDVLVKRMLPAYNADWRDRSQAWHDFIDQGGCDRVREFIRQKNYVGLDEDDILQETLITAYLKVEGGQYQDRDLAFSGFLKKIAGYKLLEALRGWHNRSALPLEDYAEVLGEVPSEHERTDIYLESEALDRALKAMPPRRRQIIAFYQSGYETDEIADQLGIREDLVRKEKSLGLRALREAVTVFLPMAEAC